MTLEIINGSFSYTENQKLLENLNLHLNEGQILSVLGQNGIGKTTFLRCLTGTLRWRSGYALYNGKKLEGISKAANIAYVPQAHPVTFPYSALDMVCMGRAKSMGFFNMPSKLDRKIAMDSLARVGMQHLAYRKCSRMSGGQLQLVYIARALAGYPELLILDEPESHLDFKNQSLILNIITGLVSKNKIACIINTHHPEHALRISDYTLLLGEKGLYTFGKTQHILNEENIYKYFDMKVKLIDLKTLGVNQKTFVIDEKERCN